MTMVGRQRIIRREICPRDQNQRQVRYQCDLSQPLQYSVRQSLVLIHNRRKISNSHSNIL